MNVVITKLSQDVNLGTGETENFALIYLPNGGIIRAKINEEAAQAITDCFINGTAAQRTPSQEAGYYQGSMAHSAPMVEAQIAPAGFRPSTMPDGSAALEFGGDIEPPQPTKDVPKAKVRLVGKDEMGYPIMRKVGTEGADPGEITSGGYGSDEDGVGQV